MTASWPTVGLPVNASVFVNTLRCNYFESAMDRPCIWSREDTLLMSLSGLVSEESRLQGLRPENGRDRVRETQSCHHPSASRARSAGGLLSHRAADRPVAYESGGVLHRGVTDLITRHGELR